MISKNRGFPQRRPQEARWLSSSVPRHSSARWGGSETPLLARDRKFLKDWTCLRSPIPACGGLYPPLLGTRRDKVAWQRYSMLLECQNQNPLSDSKFWFCGPIVRTVRRLLGIIFMLSPRFTRCRASSLPTFGPSSPFTWKPSADLHETGTSGFLLWILCSILFLHSMQLSNPL